MTERVFEAPGIGTWELDSTHMSKPLSLFAQAAFTTGFPRGFKQGTHRFGLTMSHLEPAFIHGFTYYRAALAGTAPGQPPAFDSPEMLAYFEAGRRNIESKAWRQDLARWDDEVKPDSVRRQTALQGVEPRHLDDDALTDHLRICAENLEEMVYRHHVFTAPSIVPMGLYLAKATEWTGLPGGKLLAPLKGSSPVSAGLAAGELQSLAAAIQRAGELPAPLAVDPTGPAGEALSALCALPGEVGEAATRYVERVGFRVVSGYDVTERYVLEQPELLLKNIRVAVGAVRDGDATGRAEAAVRDVTEQVRDAVPATHRQEFDELLGEARAISRLRDERGLYNELWGVGLFRRAILAAGDRLAERGQIPSAELAVHSSLDTLTAALAGQEALDVTDLEEQAAWYASKTVEDAPAFLGDPPQPPPPPEALPEPARLGHIAMGAAMGNLFDMPREVLADGAIEGLSVSTGVYTGRARVVLTTADFARLERGDVLVTKNTSAAFNVVLPLLGAIVTDRGGQLSHAAIVAREYGIPGVVSTMNATSVIADRAKVRVDGNTGRVELV